MDEGQPVSEEPRAGRLAGTHWNPEQYRKFSDQRARPARELLERIPLEAPRVVVDLGCGTGEATRSLAARWSSARVVGLDHSPEMLQCARSTPGAVDWVEADIATWSPREAPDLLWSNAALHWVEGHRTLFPRLAGCVNRGGSLAVQMPLSWDLPSHRLMRATLEDGGPGGRALGTQELRSTAARKWVENAETYYDLLAGSARTVDVWETEYLQVLEGPDPVLEWVRGTGLRPVLAVLEDDERGLFLTEYRRRLRAAYPLRADGRTVYRFRRLFIVALF